MSLCASTGRSPRLQRTEPMGGTKTPYPYRYTVRVDEAMKDYIDNKASTEFGGSLSDCIRAMLEFYISSGGVGIKN